MLADPHLELTTALGMVMDAEGKLGTKRCKVGAWQHMGPALQLCMHIAMKFLTVLLPVLSESPFSSCLLAFDRTAILHVLSSPISDCVACFCLRHLITL